MILKNRVRGRGTLGAVFAPEMRKAGQESGCETGARPSGSSPSGPGSFGPAKRSASTQAARAAVRSSPRRGDEQAWVAGRARERCTPGGRHRTFRCREISPSWPLIPGKVSGECCYRCRTCRAPATLSCADGPAQHQKTAGSNPTARDPHGNSRPVGMQPNHKRGSEGDQDEDGKGQPQENDCD